ncbi:hypothetical protein LEM8419_00297 [Neolewinella maritima]|uniref:DUF4174 domain-containing protein n=1 Tax=Neolewinella maritima TaxID=1383882 RepID=A0ABM9AX31_9BACT|nr:DUF4174 domain-containing protein [Neolewinella maritima]CAH0999004.1 hypothetical protein LEM8419_00297 [Neolewinella maritima]
MKASALLICLSVLLPLTATAQSLSDYQWKARLILVFTPDISDPLFVEQYGLLQQAAEELEERMIKIMLITPDGEHENTGIFLGESASRYFYDHFSAEPYQMELILVGLDSYEKYRARNTVTPPSVLLNLIDSMPMRQQEIQQGYNNKSQINQTESVLPTETGGGY